MKLRSSSFEKVVFGMVINETAEDEPKVGILFVFLRGL